MTIIVLNMMTMFEKIEFVDTIFLSKVSVNISGLKMNV